MKLQDLTRYGVTRPQPVRPEPAREPVQTLLSGNIVTLASGRSFYREEQYPGNFLHGIHSVGELANVSGRRLGLISKDPELAYADLSGAVFIDTETTGLSMGVGTYIFLVGVGYVDGGSFRVRQYFLSGPDEELGYLDALDRFLREFSVIVTFNGKAFDWPLLEGRFARFRRPPPLQDPPHVDLLHPARRIWKRRLESCALTSLEANVLRVARTQHDVPGYEIPRRYFMYLRAGDGAGLEGVFYHNMQDILSLAALAIRIDCLLGDPFAGLLDEGVDFFCIGKVFERAGENESAIMCYEEALRHPMDVEHRCDTLAHLAGVQKRLRWWEAAVQTWERLVDEGGDHALHGLIELAKYYEHVDRDYEAALEAVHHAMRLSELQPESQAAREAGELEHRLGRLLQRASTARGRYRARG